MHIGHLDATPEEIKIISTLVDSRVKGIGRTVRFSDKIEELAERIYLNQVRGGEQKGNLKETVPEKDTHIPGIYKKSLAITQHRSVRLDLVVLHF